MMEYLRGGLHLRHLLVLLGRCGLREGAGRHHGGGRLLPRMRLLLLLRRWHHLHLRHTCRAMRRQGVRLHGWRRVLELHAQLLLLLQLVVLLLLLLLVLEVLLVLKLLLLLKLKLLLLLLLSLLLLLLCLGLPESGVRCPVAIGAGLQFLQSLLRLRQLLLQCARLLVQYIQYVVICPCPCSRRGRRFVWKPAPDLDRGSCCSRHLLGIEAPN